MAEDLELLRLRAKAKLKLAQRSTPEPPGAALEPPVPSAVETGLRHGARGLSFGLSDEASGIGSALSEGKEALKDVFRDAPIDEKSFLDRLSAAYKAGRDDERKILEETSEAHPVIAKMSEIAGNVATLPVFGPALKAAPIAASAGMGALQGFGESKGDLADVATDTALGGGLGAAGGKIGEKVGQSLPKIARKAGSKALGFIQTPLKKAGGVEKVERAVDTLLDEGSVIKPWRGAESMAKRLDVLENVSGKKIGSILKQMDDAGIQAVKPMNILETIQNTEVRGLGKTIAEVAEDSPEVARELKTVASWLEKRAAADGGATTFAEAQYIKRLIGKSTDWTASEASGNIGNQTKKLMYGAVNDAMDKSLGEAAEQVGDPALRAEFLQAKELFGAASTAKVGINKQLARQAGNKLFGLTDQILGGGGVGATLVTRDPETAITAAGLLLSKKLAEKYGWQTLATGARALGKVPQSALGAETGLMLERLGRTGKELIREKMPESPQVPLPSLGATVSNIDSDLSPATVFRSEGASESERTRSPQPEEESRYPRQERNQAPSAAPYPTPERMGKYAGVLRKAQESGSDGLSATHYILMQRDPEYRKMYEESADQSQSQ
jgi:hypothetical protein